MSQSLPATPATPTEDARPRTRQELYDRIRQGSKDEFILEDMLRLGFWPSDRDKPTVPENIIRRQADLERELQAHVTERKRLEDRERMLRELRKRRFKEAREKRKETKARRERERQEKAAAWRKRRQEEIVYLGETVSAGLAEAESKRERLQELGLPVLPDAPSIASAMGIDLGELRFLSFHRPTSRTTHYRRFQIPKKTGGQRLISAPMPRLKEAQRWILDNILVGVPAHEAANGFLNERSIVSNARPHVGAAFVVNMDIQDFFPTVTYKRVKGVFRALGYSEQAATIFALLSTEPEVDEVELDGVKYFVARSERHLPQGAPTSPALTNVLCRRLDRRLSALAKSIGVSYTRYADDMTFSGTEDKRSNVGELFRKAYAIVRHEGFEINPAKTRVMRRGRRQEVTGVVVNDKLGVDRKALRRFRATLFQIEKDGPKGKHWGGNEHVLHAMEGFASFVFMVDPDKGGPLLARVRKLMGEEGYRKPVWQRYPKCEPSWKKKRASETAVPAEPTEHTTPEPAKDSKKSWWKFW